MALFGTAPGHDRRLRRARPAGSFAAMEPAVTAPPAGRRPRADAADRHPNGASLRRT